MRSYISIFLTPIASMQLRGLGAVQGSDNISAFPECPEHREPEMRGSDE